tara:strand:+ start:391 stop:612 length:222 start_codon:yes stop_codon:yes gene_type:complete
LTRKPGGVWAALGGATRLILAYRSKTGRISDPANDQASQSAPLLATVTNPNDPPTRGALAVLRLCKPPSLANT